MRDVGANIILEFHWLIMGTTGTTKRLGLRIRSRLSWKSRLKLGRSGLKLRLSGVRLG